MNQPFDVAYKFVPFRAMMDPEPHLKALRRQILALGYEIRQIGPVYGGDDSLSHLEALVNGTISDIHLASIRKEGFGLAREYYPLSRWDIEYPRSLE